MKKKNNYTYFTSFQECVQNNEFSCCFSQMNVLFEVAYNRELKGCQLVAPVTHMHMKTDTFLIHYLTYPERMLINNLVFSNHFFNSMPTKNSLDCLVGVLLFNYLGHFSRNSIFCQLVRSYNTTIMHF
jgi:hypothetical protein